MDEGKNESCSFFLSRKKRYCKMLVGKGKRFCGQHLTAEDNKNDVEQKRIPCPLDPKHSCFEDKLTSHLKVCNARQKPAAPFCCKSLNEGEEEADEVSVEVQQLHLLSDEEIMHYVSKIQKIYDEHVDRIKLKIGSHPALKDELTKSYIGHSVVRHLVQNSSLLALLDDANLLHSEEEEKKVFVEFGAGRGKLTGWIIEAIKKKEEALFILIDRGAQRHKVDAKLKHKENLNIKRLRIDIQDLDLSKIEGIEEETKIIGCGKHLCGAATDFSLRCLKNCQKGTLSGIVIALCCHHRCSWKAYTGKTFLKKVGLTAKDFPILLSLTSWAVSGSRHAVNEEHTYPANDQKNIPSTDKHNGQSSDEQNLSTEGQNHSLNNDQIKRSSEAQNHTSSDRQPSISEETLKRDATNENRYLRLGLSIAFREEVGRKTKQIIDQGRVEYLKENANIQPSLVQYAEQSSTLENIALIAYKCR